MINRVMKESGTEWVGTIPPKWNLIAIRYLIAEHICGSWGNDPQNNSSDRICVRIADFDFDKMEFKNMDVSNYTVRNYSSSDIINKTLVIGDLLIEKSGGGEKTPVGRTVVYRLPYPALFANFMDCIRLTTIIDTEFAKYCFYSLYTRGITKLYFNQTTGLQNLNISKYFRETKIPVPLLKEQYIIAAFLDSKCSDIDSLTKDIESQIATLEEYKRSVITEAVTKGLNPDGEMKESGIDWIGEIPTPWEIGKIVSLFALRNQKVSDCDYPPLSVTMKGIMPQLETAAKTNAHDDRKLVKVGDFVINSRSDRRGSCGISNLEGSVSLINTVLKPRNNMSCSYYNWLFHTELFADEFYKCGHGIVDDLWTTGWQEMKKIGIPVPQVAEQNRIANYLDSKCSEIDAIITDKKKQLEILSEYKKSLIYEYVTGKKEVPA